MKKEMPVPKLLQSDGPRVIVLDIETAPSLVHTFSLFNTNISLDQVVKPTAILSVSWKFLDSDAVFFWSTRDKEDPYDDRDLCESLWGLLNGATHVVGHNSTKFDLPIIYGRCFHHGLPPIRKPVSLDTRTMAKQVGNHYSNKLAHLSSKLGNRKSDHGKFPGFELWKECLAGNPEAWDEMRDYNEKDVKATEELFKALLPYSNTSIQWRAPSEEGPCCPRCGSHDLRKKGSRVTQVGEYQRYLCNSCHGWSQSRFTSRRPEVSRNILKAA